MPDAAWSTIFLIIIVGINFMGVRIYGELEYWFALIKIIIVIVFIIIGTVLFSRSGKNKQNKKLMLFLFPLAILTTAGAIGGKTIGFT